MDAITAQEAKARGLFRFFTGQPCRHGHIAERLISNNGCIECQRSTKNARRRTRVSKDRRNARLKLKRQQSAKLNLKPCAVCSIPFNTFAGNRFCAKTCSPQCATIFYRRHSPRKVPDRVCTFCGSMFASRNPRQSACSYECRRAHRQPKIKVCAQCKEEFILTCHGGSGFCSAACRAARHTEIRAAAHQKLRRDHPEKIRARRKNYEIVHAEAHRLTTRNVNAKRMAREVAALAVAQSMIPRTLKNTKGRKAKIKASIDFLQSIGVTPSNPLESTNVTL